jgi:hypothetical protein
LSYRRTSEATPTSGAASTTVCTNDLALCNLVEGALPVSVSDAFGDIEFLIPEAVELEDNKIRLPAIRGSCLQAARQGRQQLSRCPRAFRRQAKSSSGFSS